MTTSSGINNPSSHDVGYARLRAINVSTMVVAVTFPSSLDALSFAGDWAVSESANSGYSAISGTSNTQSSLGGIGGDETRHYRFGGRVTGIASTTGTRDLRRHHRLHHHVHAVAPPVFLATAALTAGYAAPGALPAPAQDADRSVPVTFGLEGPVPACARSGHLPTSTTAQSSAVALANQWV